MPVHPHARGERVAWRVAKTAGTGSSPRTWGTLRFPMSRLQSTRFIPTHVGNANRLGTSVDGVAVHPHARGERIGERALELVNAGSSPRTWGTLYDWRNTLRRRRFIPTHVGNADDATLQDSADAVHPHARGERASPTLRCHRANGSSPRTWGTRTETGYEQPFYRFIPTHVGNAPGCRRETSIQTVHPHARGERIRLVFKQGQKVGSSPRTWGTLPA